ncbi:aldehyde dehydrogenase [candidate division TA06 bacterium DG_26]|uniref:aldehyde dehydrogenase (NAD(+)) n=1 Tax=candidate division TA06 bacterium DG_26 TaxID=1703771 RepID=A0A0S7WJL7_UNCT6|nr:MAG: aldehyde dehydrogenase [candidate division TA06 bacterium DG_26]
MAELFQNYVEGKWAGSKGGETFEDRNPANWKEIVGIFPKSTKEDVETAIQAAKKAYPAWARVPAPRRGEILRRVGELLLEKKEEIGTLMTREMGKVLKEAKGDVQEGIDTAFYAFGEGRRLHTPNTPSELTEKVCLTFRQPIGVCGIITPWNFPIAIPTWKIFPALLCGNTVVFKPATDTPACGGRLVEILVEAGIPAGVVNLVYGSGREVGEVILAHNDVRLVSFTGSSLIGKRIGEVCGKTLKRCSLELGGKNAQIVLDDADQGLALEGALWGAFGTTGQRCTATSRLIVQKGIYKKFIDGLVQRANQIKIGSGLKREAEMGPLINEKQRETVHKYVEIGKKEGATLVCGGEPYEEGECANGWFYKPTIFVDVKPHFRIAQEEIFGPVLSVMKVDDLDAAVNALNDSAYGLSSSIYTRDVNSAFRAMERIEAGITYINGPTIGAECHLPFGGVKDTGNGHREGGWTAYEVFTEFKTVYIDYSERLQKAQIDTWE